MAFRIVPDRRFLILDGQLLTSSDVLTYCAAGVREGATWSFVRVVASEIARDAYVSMLLAFAGNPMARLNKS